MNHNQNDYIDFFVSRQLIKMTCILITNRVK